MRFTTLPISLLLAVSSAFTFVAAQSSTAAPTSSSVTASTSASGASATLSRTESSSRSLGGSATSTASLPSFSGYSVCVDSCIDSAVGFTGCPSVADVDCYCSAANSTTFAQNLTSCLASNCPSSISPAESLANQLCAAASQSTSISFATTSISISVTSSSISVTSSSATSSGANTTSHSATSLTTSASTSTTSTGAGVRQSVDGKLFVSLTAGLVAAAFGMLSGL